MATNDQPIRNLVLGVDEGDYSWEALGSAKTVAEGIGADLRLLHVGHVEEGITTRAAASGLTLDNAAGQDTTEAIAEAIVGHVAGLDDAIAVLTSHARRAVTATLLGSTASAVLAASVEPVLLFGPNHEAPQPISRVLACIDGSDVSESALGAACRWARAADVPLWLVHVVEPQGSIPGGVSDSNYVHRVAEELDTTGLDIEFDVLHGEHPGQAISDYANGEPGSLTVLATHGRSGIREIVMGSVAMDVTRRSTGPTLVLRAR